MTRHLLLAADSASTIIGASHQVRRDYGEQAATQIGIRYPATGARSPARQPGHDRRERLHGALRHVDVADAELAAALLELVADFGDRPDQGVRMLGQHLVRDAEPPGHHADRVGRIVAYRDEVGRALELDVAEPGARALPDPADLLRGRLPGRPRH